MNRIQRKQKNADGIKQENWRIVGKKEVQENTGKRGGYREIREKGGHRVMRKNTGGYREIRGNRRTQRNTGKHRRIQGNKGYRLIQSKIGGYRINTREDTGKIGRYRLIRAK